MAELHLVQFRDLERDQRVELPKAYTPQEVQKALGVKSIDSIYRVLADGTLRGFKIGRGARSWRVSAEALAEYMREQASEPAVDQQIAELVRQAPPLSDEAVNAIVAIIRADGGRTA